jgi:hypothetical protein|uniref:Uncharacterized protein n=1 Tax=Desulfomonile tiedjei TaxID=2358 RepID=A0A7C4ETN9_9BACT
MNDQGVPRNSNVFAKDRTNAELLSPARSERGAAPNQSTRFTKLVAEQPVAQGSKPTTMMDRERMSPPGFAHHDPAVCPHCAGAMKKSSRAILSIPAGVALAALGCALMVFYGYATNFSQVPWFVRFALPAAYYLGSIFIGVGILFFFIRERIWRCRDCGQVLKR